MSARPQPPASGSLLSVHAALITAQVCGASLPVLGRIALLGHMGPNAIVLIRLVGGALVFAALAYRRGAVPVRRADWPRLLASSLLGMTLNMSLFVNGLRWSTAINATVLGTTVPVFTAICAMLLGYERPRRLRTIGIAVALGGALVLVGAERLSTAPEHSIGSVMILGNSLCYGIFLVVVRPLTLRYPAFDLMALLLACAIPFVLPLGIPEVVSLWARFTVTDLFMVLYLIAVPTVGAYVLTQVALQRADSSLVASYIYLQPLLATLGAMLLLGEQPGARTVVAAILIFSGVFLSTRAADHRLQGASSIQADCSDA